MLDRCAVALDRTDQPVDLVLSLTVRLQVRRPRAAGFTALARRIDAVGSNNFSADAVSVDFGLTWPSRGSRCRCGGRMVLLPFISTELVDTSINGQVMQQGRAGIRRDAA